MTEYGALATVFALLTLANGFTAYYVLKAFFGGPDAEAGYQAALIGAVTIVGIILYLGS